MASPDAPGGYRLLIASGVRDEAQALQKYFIDHGLVVDVVYDGGAGLLNFVHTPPDAILVESALEKLDTLDLIKRVRGHLARGGTPVFVMADRLQSPQEEEELRSRLKADAVFRKPMPLKEVLVRFDELVSARTGNPAPTRTTTSTRLAAVKPPMPGALPLADFGKPATLSGAPAPVAVATTPARSTTSPSAPAFGKPATTAPAPLHIPAPTPAFGKPATQAPAPIVTPAAAKPAAPGGAPWAFGKPQSTTQVPPAARPAAPGELTGPVTPPALSTALLSIFERRLDGVLDLKHQNVTRSLFFQDGVLVDVRSSVAAEALTSQAIAAKPLGDEVETACPQGAQLMLGETGIDLGGVPRVQVLIRVEKHVRELALVAMAAGGAFSFRQSNVNPVLGSVVLLDPLELIQQLCLRIPSPSTWMEPHKHHHVLTGDAFNARVLIFSRLSPQSMVPAALLDSPTLGESMTRASASGERGVQELLALVLSRSVGLGPKGRALPASKRASSALPAPGDWTSTGQARWLRHEVAHEWLRTVGRSPMEILQLQGAPSVGDVRAAAGAQRARFGPTALEDQDLGAARMFLEVIRRRRDEAVRALQKT